MEYFRSVPGFGPAESLKSHTTAPSFRVRISNLQTRSPHLSPLHLSSSSQISQKDSSVQNIYHIVTLEKI
jgi:hypothetical protein